MAAKGGHIDFMFLVPPCPAAGSDAGHNDFSFLTFVAHASGGVFTGRKQGFGQGNNFTGVSLSRGEESLSWGLCLEGLCPG